MRIHIHCRDIAVQLEMMTFVQRRALFALGRFGPRIRNAHICLWDSNDPRGSRDQCCDAHIDFGAGKPLIIRERQVSVQAAATVALARAEHAIARQIELAKVNRTTVSRTYSE